MGADRRRGQRVPAREFDQGRAAGHAAEMAWVVRVPVAVDMVGMPVYFWRSRRGGVRPRGLNGAGELGDDL